MHPKSQTLMEVHIFMGKKGDFASVIFVAGFQLSGTMPLYG